MRGISDKIEAFINELLKDEPNEWIELRRNELANVFDCVPSQINYVITTRFNPSTGYLVESRRGGGGYVRIKRLSFDKNLYLEKIIAAIGDTIDERSTKLVVNNLYKNELINEHELGLMLSATSDKALIIREPEKSIVRANVIRHMIASLAI